VLATLPDPLARATIAAAVSDGDTALDDLLETSLVEVRGAPTDAERRYGLHAITRGFVLRTLPLEGLAREKVVSALLGHFAEMGHRLGGSTRNWRGFGRLEEQLDNILALTESGSAGGEALDRAVLQLAHGYRNVFLFGRAWSQGLSLLHRAREAASRLGDTRALGWNTYRLGLLHLEPGTSGYGEAAARGREAAALLAAAGDPRGQGHALRLQARAIRNRGQLREAEQLLQESEQLLRAHGLGDDVAIVLASRAEVLRRTEREAEALAIYQGALRDGLVDQGTEANVRSDIAEILLDQDEQAEAAESFKQALALAEEAGARGIAARSHLGLARIARNQALLEVSRTHARTAADAFARLGDSERLAQARELAGTSAD
jgi:tetratricopeptide (TPR) repeat protein